MKKEFLNLWNRCILIILLILASHPDRMDARGSGQPATSAPLFSLVDLEGQTRNLSDYKGKIIVLEWTNPNCPFVVRHYGSGDLQLLQKKYTEKGIVWFTVNSTNSGSREYSNPKELKEKYLEWKAAYTAQLLDAEGEVGKMYDAKTTPHIFIIDTNGAIAYQGAVDDDPRGKKETKVNYVSDALDALLAGKPVVTTATQPYGCSVKYAQ